MLSPTQPQLTQQPRGDMPATSPARYRIALLLVTIAVLIPIWLVDHPGMVDYPNHLARCYVLAHFHQNPVWPARYIVDRSPLPNLAIDLIVVPLNHLLPIILSGKLFLTLTAVVYILGCIWLGRAVTGSRSWLALIAALTFYNSATLYGFVNYLFGVGVFLCAFAFWLESRERITWLRFIVCGLFSIAAFLSHLSAVVFLGACCTTIALVELRTHRNLLHFIRQLAWLGCPLIIMFGFLKGSGRLGPVEWATLSGKVIHLFVTIRSYSLAVDAIVLAVLAFSIVVLLRKARIHSVWIAGLVLFVLFLISPDGLFQSSAVDARYVLPACILLFLSIEPSWLRPQKIAFAVLLAAMLLRTVEIAANWVAIDQREQRVLAMGSLLPTDARVYVMPHLALRVPSKQDRSIYHVVTLWTIYNQADVSTLFSTPGMQPLVARHGSPCKDIDWSQCVPHYGFVWTDDPLPATEALLRTLADPIATWDSVTLWRVRKSAE